MNRKDLQTLSKMRLNEAKSLLQSRHWQGAYYLAGYSVECALKACIAKQVQKHEFPDKTTVQRSHVHDLEKLLGVAGLRTKLDADARTNEALEVNWSVVKDWSSESRYLPAISEAVARDMISACATEPNGVLKWLRKSW